MRNKLVSAIVSGCCGLLIVCGTLPLLAQDKQPPIVLNIKPPHASTDKSIKYDYDIVYVRGPRRTDGKEVRWAEFSKPNLMELGWVPPKGFFDASYIAFLLSQAFPGASARRSGRSLNTSNRGNSCCHVSSHNGSWLLTKSKGLAGRLRVRGPGFHLAQCRGEPHHRLPLQRLPLLSHRRQSAHASVIASAKNDSNVPQRRTAGHRLRHD
jgi:hypothetical protein